MSSFQGHIVQPTRITEGGLKHTALAQLSTLLAPMMQAFPGRLINFNGSEIDLLLQVFIFLSLSNSEPQKQAALESISPLACQLTH